MLGQLKDKFFSLQEEISTSVKNLAPLATGAASTERTRPAKINLDAGGDLLESWQINWEELHVNNERNGKAAQRCDRMITQLKHRTEKQWKDVSALQVLVSEIPKVNAQINEIMDCLANLESLFGDVEIDLLTLEDTINAREMQEKQLDQRFQLAMYQERRKAEFNDLANRLQSDYQKKKAEHEKLKKLRSKEKQDFYQSQFEKDMADFKSKSGGAAAAKASSSSRDNNLSVPCRHDPDASLESVDLDEIDPEHDVGDNGQLETFLNEPDLLYDVSPLPKDETPLKKSDSAYDEVDLNDIPINVIGEDGGQVELAQAGAAPGGVPHSSTNMSVAESLYYTPDVTLEKLSDLGDKDEDDATTPTK